MQRYTRVPEPTNPNMMGSMHMDDRIRLTAQRQEASSRATLAQSLVRMGRTEEALEIGPADKKDEYRALLVAEAAPDDERCGCVKLNDTADYTRNRNAKPKLVEAQKYLRKLRAFSEKYGQMVWYYQCSVCGHMNAVPDDVIVEEELVIADNRNEELKAKRQEAYDAEVARIMIARTKPEQEEKEKSKDA